MTAAETGKRETQESDMCDERVQSSNPVPYCFVQEVNTVRARFARHGVEFQE